MLKRLAFRGFKSLREVSVDLPRLAVLFGPNAAGKSNLVDAIQAVSRIGTQRTLADALGEPMRGYPIEAFLFPSGGLAELLASASARFSLEADLARDRDTYRYRVEVEITPGSGTPAISDEYLSALGKDGERKGTAAIELMNEKLRVRRKSHPGKPRYEPVRQNYAILSDPRLACTTSEMGGSMKITYDREVDALCIRFKETTVTTKHLGEGIAADYDAEGRLAGIEIIDALRRLGDPEVFRQVILEDIALRTT